MGTHPIFESDFDCLTDEKMSNSSKLTIGEQMLASMSGAGITALTMTPFDVVKVRLQAGKTSGNRVIQYCNGLMDHVICCRDPKGKRLALDCLSKVSKIGCQNGKCGSKSAATCRLGICFSQPLHNAKCIYIEECSKKKFAPTVSKPSKLPWYLRSCPVGVNNPFRLMFQLARNEGVGTLWSGLPATIVMAFPATVLYFTAFEQFNSIFAKILNEENSKEPFLAPFLGGASARLVTATVVSPLELIRTRMQMDSLSWSETKSSIRTSYQAKGFQSLFLGYGATLLRDVPFSAVYFGIYKLLQSKSDNIENRTFANFVCASAAATIAGTITLPFDVIKTRQQVLLGTDLTGNHRILDIAKDIVKNDGSKGFMRGFSPRLMKVTPACAIMMCSYEWTKEYFHQKKLN